VRFGVTGVNADSHTVGTFLNGDAAREAADVADQVDEQAADRPDFSVVFIARLGLNF
jgi:hypothetical protein